MVELVEPLQEETLDHDPQQPDDERGDNQRWPVAESGILEDQIGSQCAQHVLSAMCEIDDVEHAEDDGEPQAEQRVERAVDQPDQKLTKQSHRGNALSPEQHWKADLEHASSRR